MSGLVALLTAIGALAIAITIAAGIILTGRQSEERRGGNLQLDTPAARRALGARARAHSQPVHGSVYSQRELLLERDIAKRHATRPLFIGRAFDSVDGYSEAGDGGWVDDANQEIAARELDRGGEAA